MTHADIVGEIAETTALRRVLPEKSEILAATEDRERLLRTDLSMTPEHKDAQLVWREMHVERAPPVAPPARRRLTPK